MTNYHGLYINLDRSPARRNAIQAQMQAQGISALYARFSATDGNTLPPDSHGRITAGEAGAFHSHTAALTEAAARNVPVHMLEDDALISRHTRPVIEQAIASGLLDKFDLLFMDTFVAPDLGMLKVLGQAFDRTTTRSSVHIGLADLQLIDVSRQNFACLTSYVIGPRGFARVLPLLRAELQAGPRMPIDLFLRQCAFAARLSVGLLAPFVTGFSLEEAHQSTVAAGSAAAKPSVMVFAVLRYLFFVERDLQLARACLESVARNPGRQRELQSQLVLDAVEFILSEDFQQF
jgi:GR25 family glycosyltransferase involved in LPS biosynthesis